MVLNAGAPAHRDNGRDNKRDNREVTSDWARYWRATDRPMEAMYAHFRRHAYHRHSHETYSFGVTESGAQAFTCRGAGHTSGAGMVMLFNPDDPHDGHAAGETGFTYRMIHVDPALVTDVLADTTGRRPARPLFADPVLHDPALAGALRRLHSALTGGADAMLRDELLDGAVRALVRRGAVHRLTAEPLAAPTARTIARRVRELLADLPSTDLTADDLAAAAGCSRYAMYRAFRVVYGMSPSDYQRQLRLRTARRLLAHGAAPAVVAAETGFADQAHLTRWFVRCFGVTPGAFRRAAG